jgi:hypothetical protein
MTHKTKRMRAMVVLSLLLLVSGLVAGPAGAAPAAISRLTISDVNDVSFVVSWVTDVAANGSVTWGTSDPPTNTVTDSVSSTTTHYVMVSGLSPNTTYYYRVTSGSDVSSVYQVQTGPSATSTPSTTVWGYVYQSNGSTVVPNAIVYLQIQDANGSGSLGSSQLVSARADGSGLWNYNLGNIRTSNFQAYFSFTTADTLRLIGQGGSAGTRGLDPTPFTIAVPGGSLFQQNIILNQTPTAVTLAMFEARGYPGSVQLEWSTGTEVGLLGFNLYRAEAPGGVRTQLNGSLIPAATPGELGGNVYKYGDESVETGETYTYWIELEMQGENQEGGPLTVLAPYGVFLPMVGR